MAAENIRTTDTPDTDELEPDEADMRVLAELVTPTPWVCQTVADNPGVVHRGGRR